MFRTQRLEHHQKCYATVASGIASKGHHMPRIESSPTQLPPLTVVGCQPQHGALTRQRRVFRREDVKALCLAVRKEPLQSSDN
jgi:hypothetical protein